MLAVQDDGCGLEGGAEGGRGMGLHIMHYRAHMIGGEIHIDSAPDRGTRVTCRLPLPDAPPPA